MIHASAIAGRLLAALLGLVLVCAVAAPAAAEARPTLVIALHARPADRPALRTALLAEQAARLKQLKQQGAIAGYSLLFARYADTGAWDGMEVLTFADEAALARWQAVEREAPGGLSPKVLALTQAIETTPGQRIRGNGPGDAAAPVLLVIPYVALVPTGDYVAYLDGYTLPQFEGWISEGVLDGYDVILSRYPADRPWSAMIVLRYRNDAALARRDEVVATVRARLAQNPDWKAISDNKKSMRAEKALSVADVLASSGAAR